MCWLWCWVMISVGVGPLLCWVGVPDLKNFLPWRLLEVLRLQMISVASLGHRTSLERGHLWVMLYSTVGFGGAYWRGTWAETGSGAEWGLRILSIRSRSRCCRLTPLAVTGLRSKAGREYKSTAFFFLSVSVSCPDIMWEEMNDFKVTSCQSVLKLQRRLRW